MQRIKIAQIGTSQNSHGNDIWNTICEQETLYEVAGYALPENGREKFPDRMKDFEGFPGGMMFFLDCHLIDMIFQIKGEPEEVIPLNCSTGIDDIHTDDCGKVVLKVQ